MSTHPPTSSELRWYRVADPAELPEGRVMTVVAGHKTLALTHFEGKFNALDNACPHQGGPLGESCGALGLRVTRKEELEDALQKGLTHDGPALIEVMTDVELI